MASQTTITNEQDQKWKILFDLGHELAFNLNMLTDDQESLDFIYAKTSELINTKCLFIVLGNKITTDHKLHILNKSNDSAHEELRLLVRKDKKKVEKLFVKESHFFKTQTEVATFFDELNETEKNKFPATWLTAPIRWRDRIAGTFIIYHPTQNDAFNENDHQFLQAISHQVAVYLYNRRLSLRQIIVSEIAKKLTSTIQFREEEVLELIYEQACQLMYCRNMSVILRDKQTGDLRFALVYENGKFIDVDEQEQKRLSQQPAMARIKQLIKTNKSLLLKTPVRVKASFKELGVNENELKNTPATWMAVPMRLGEKGQPAMGVFVVYHNTQSRAYDEADCDTLNTMSDQVAIALDNVYSNQKLEQLAEHSFSKKINLTEEDVLELICRKAGEFIGNTSKIFIILKDKGQTNFKSSEGGKLADWSEQYKNRACRILVEGILENKESVLLKNSEAVRLKLGTHYSGKLPASWLGVPMRLGDRAIGVFITYNEKVEYAYDSTDEKVLDILSDRAAIILDNARLNQRQKVLSEIGQELTESIKITESDIVSIIYERAKHLMDVNNMYIILQDDITGEFCVALAYKDSQQIETDVAKDESAYKLAQHKIQKVLMGESNIILLETKDEIKKIFTTSKIVENDLKNMPATWLCVPMRIRNETMGVFVVYHPTQEFAYNKEDAELLDAMSDYAAIAIDNHRLIQRRDVLVQIQKSTTELRLEEEEEFIKSITEQGEITQLGFGEKEVIDLTHEQASKLIDTSNLSILLKNEETGQPYSVLSYKDNELVNLEKEKNWDLITDLTEEVFDNNRLVHRQITDFDQVDRWWLGVPMRLQDKVLGAFVMHRATSPYGKDVAGILDTMSDHAAITIDNARKHAIIVDEFKNQNRYLENQNRKLNALNRKLNALIQVAQELTFNIELSDEQILGMIHTQANKMMDTRNMYAALYDEQNDMVRFPLYFENNILQQISPRKMGQGKTEEIIRTKKPIFHPTLAESKKWYSQSGRTDYVGEPLPSWIGVPMMFSDKVLGVIAAYHPTQEHVYSKDDLGILEALANLAAIALENAGLYTESKQQTRALEKANRSIIETEAALNQAMFANDFVHRINNQIGTIPIWINEIRDGLEAKELNKRDINTCLDQVGKDIDSLLRTVETIKEPEKEVEVDIANMLESMLEQLNIQYHNEIQQQKLEISDNIDKQKHKVFGLYSSLSSCFYNVLSNGIESILEGKFGKLTINVTNNSDGFVKIEMTDTGKGISERNMEKIFTSYFTTKGRGRGYGLWRTRKIIEDDFKGKITVNSQKNEGATFTILLKTST